MATVPKKPARTRQVWTGEVPSYRLTEQAFLEPHGEDSARLIEEGQDIEFTGVPGAHMEPLNKAAQDQIDKYKPQALDINRMTPMEASKIPA